MEKVGIENNGLTIKLTDFEGPIDLLLHLIKKSEMDIFDLPIAEITTQYLDFIHTQQAMQLDVASEYLVMAATLMQIKSYDLLPNDIVETDFEDDEYTDPREELMLQLLTYKQFQVVSETLREREQSDQQSFPRLPMMAPEDVDQEIGLAPGLGLVDLQMAFTHLLAKKRQQQPISRRVVTEKYTITDAVSNIHRHLLGQKVGDMVAFTTFFDDVYEREPLVMTFLALLEMAKAEKISLHQMDYEHEFFVEIEDLD